MTDNEFQISKYILFDTNILHSFIDAVSNDEVKYGILLDDIEKVVNYKKYSFYISEDIKKELGDIVAIRDFDRSFQKKRVTNPRINFFHIDKNHPLIPILQPLFKGNINLETGKRDLEKADHTLLINAVELLKHNGEDSIQAVIYSNDHEVEEITKKLGPLLPREFNFTAENISWMAGFQFVIEMLYLKAICHLDSNIDQILKYTLENYYNRRKNTSNHYQTVDLLYKSLKFVIKDFESGSLKIKVFETKIAELQKKLGEGQGDLIEYRKTIEKEEENEEKLLQAISQVESGQIEEGISALQNQEIRNYGSILRTYYQIVYSNEFILHRYYRDWNKVLTSKKSFMNQEIKKQLDKNVFISLVQYEVELFKDNKLSEAHGLSIELMPLLAEVQWDVDEENKKLEQYYIIAFYLALARNDIPEFSEIIEVLKVAIQERSCENEQIKQFVQLGELILDMQGTINLSQQFKTQLITNIKEFYLVRQWMLVWNLILPLWKILSQNEKDSLRDLIELTCWVTLEPPERLQDLWEEIKISDRINVSRELLGEGIMDSEVDLFKKESVPDFLKGEHIVIDTKMIGRAHAIIHVKSKKSRFGIDKNSSTIDLSNAQTIEFTKDSISQYVKKPSGDEKSHKICGIIKLNKVPNLIIKERKLKLDNVII